MILISLKFYQKKDEFLIFIDDISITGTHQLIIERMLKDNDLSNATFFLYLAKLINTQISPSVENELNYSYVKGYNEIITLMNESNFGLTTRMIKYILQLSSSEFKKFIDLVIINQKKDKLGEIYEYSILNKYNLFHKMNSNLQILKMYL